jgi:hypothetical protein
MESTKLNPGKKSVTVRIFCLDVFNELMLDYRVDRPSMLEVYIYDTTSLQERLLQSSLSQVMTSGSLDRIYRTKSSKGDVNASNTDKD